MGASRPLVIYEPAAEKAQGKDLPVVYCLAAWTNAGRSLMNWAPFRESLPDRLDRLIAQETIPPCLVVCPDLYTEYGGSQFVNSEFFGPHGDHIVHEVIPFVESSYPVLNGPRHRGVMGISSGGFGALRFGMDYDDAFGAVACHSGDMGFELVYGRDLVTLALGLAPFDGDPQAFIDQCFRANRIGGREIHLLMLLGMAGTYSPGRDSPWGYHLPIDIETAKRIPEVWQRWLDHDPLERVLVEQCQSRLKSLHTLYIECGTRDQYYLQFGARQLTERLSDLGVRHDYQEFDGTHSGLSYRYDTSLSRMVPNLI